MAYSLGYYDEYEFSVFVEKCVTCTSHTKRGLQAETINLVLQAAKFKGALFAVAAVSPKNETSIRNFRRCGFHVAAEKYNLFGSANTRTLLVCRLR